MQQGFESPTTVDQAVALLEKHGAEARPLAGGTDLLVQMRSGIRTPAVVLDLKRIPEAMALELGGDEIVIGAARSTAALRENAALVALFPGLLEAAELIGSEQIQGRASLGGNLCNASPAADTPPVLVANDAVCEIVGPGGRRRLPVAELPQGPGRTALAPGEFVVALHLPRPPARTADAYQRFIPRTEMDIAVVGVGARISLDADGVCTAAKVALGAVGPTVLTVPGVEAALVGETIDEATLERAAEAARAVAAPIDDKRGSAEFRTHITGVLTKRTIAVAAERAATQEG